nr:zinc finger, CCHC-type [Tanacetum cinerariifolium]
MASSITRFDIKKFDGKNVFELWQIMMRALMVHQGCYVALETLPADIKPYEKAALMKKAYSTLILFLGRRLDHSRKAHSGGSLWFTSWGRTGKLKCFICHSEGHLKKDYTMKKSSGFVKKGKRDQDFYSSDDEGNAYFGEALVVVENDKMIELVMASCGSYHMIHMADFLYDFKGFDGVGFKQLGPGVETGVHEVQDEKCIWFEVELQGAQKDREAEGFQVSNDDASVGQRRLEDTQLEEKINIDCLEKEQEKKKVKESMEANIGKLLNYNVYSLGSPRFEVPAQGKDAEESLTMDDALVTLNSRELKKRTEGTQEETSDGLSIKERFDHSGKAHSGKSLWFMSRGRTGKLKCFICHSKGHMKRDCLMKNSSGFVKKAKNDQDSNSSNNEGNAYFREALVVVKNDEMTKLVMDSCGSYHMTHMRDFLYDFKSFDGGSIQLGGSKHYGNQSIQEGAEGNVAEKEKVKESMEANIVKLLYYNACSTMWSSIQGSDTRKRC